MAAHIHQRTFLGHPVGLYVLFFTEMWERFSYYGMRALLILYLINYFKMTQEDAAYIYKWYTSLVYLTPVIGGFLADRYLGNRMAVVIGATLMAIGHFLMAFEEIGIIYAALGFLIVGNGFFKPNMSTQVGRLYPNNDKRRDGAYTIFYMGINIGACISPLLCGWLAQNTVGEYHSGFTLAGIGMVTGLLIYLLGQPLIKEVDPGAQAEPEFRAGTPSAAKERVALTEAEADQTPSQAPFFSRIAPQLLVALGIFFPLLGLVGGVTGYFKLFDIIATVLASGCAFFAAWICSQVHNASRDRVLAVFLLGILSIFFWAAFEQTGNALNIWADKVTDRYLTEEDQPPEIYPSVVEVPEEAEKQAGTLLNRFETMFNLKENVEGVSLNPVPTPWFQSINAFLIIVLAPVFAWLWVKVMIPIPVKMIFGISFMAAAMLVMVFGAMQEFKPTEVTYTGAIPEGATLTDQNELAHQVDGEIEVYHTGRLKYDPDEQKFVMNGVLPDIERDRIVRNTAPKWFQEQIDDLVKRSATATPNDPVTLELEKLPEGFDWRYAGLPKAEVAFSSTSNTITVKRKLGEKEKKAILLAAGDPEFREAMNQLMVRSADHRVMPWWLVWHFLLATIGELCLSPVGLSAVSKLAPTKYATMLMGMWLLSNFFAGVLAGTMGELYSKIPPIEFFTLSVVALGVLALVATLFVKKVIRMMHGVN